MKATTLEGAVRGRSCLTEATFELARGDVERACEHGWKAAELLLTAIADERGWQLDARRHFHDIANRLDEELGDEDIRTLFAYAGQLRFFGDVLDAETVEYSLARVAKLVACIESTLSERV